MIRIKMFIIARLTVEQNCALLTNGGSIIMRIYTHSACTEHKVPEGHSEQPDRLIHLLSHLEHTGISKQIPYYQATPINREQALKVHDLELYQELERLTPKQELNTATELKITTDANVSKFNMAVELHKETERYPE